MFNPERLAVQGTDSSALPFALAVKPAVAARLMNELPDNLQSARSEIVEKKGVTYFCTDSRAVFEHGKKMLIGEISKASQGR